MYAQIILTQNAKAIDMAFTYTIPEEMVEHISVGTKVIVPFGQGNRLNEGFVLALSETCEYKRIKKIYQVVEGFELLPSQMALIDFLRDTYLCSFSEAITTVVPSGTKLSKTTTYDIKKNPNNDHSPMQMKVMNMLQSGPVEEFVLNDMGLLNAAKALLKKGVLLKKETFKQDVTIQYKKVVYSKVKPDDLEFEMTKLRKSASKQRQVLAFIVSVGSCDVALLYRELKATKAMLDKLLAADLIEIEEVEKNRKPDALKREYDRDKKPLNIEQEIVFNTINHRLDTHEKYLLHGVTGSGKTEVYMTLAEQVVAQNKQIIILVPEIALTPQIVGKFLKRFGNEIAVIHSKVSAGERYDQYRSIVSGEVSIIIGARSAVFSPCPNLGMIIIDEEHENTYKSDSNPKYSTVEVAEYLSEKMVVPLLVASATPSLNQYYRTTDDYTLLTLKNRFNDKALPEVSLVDMREELLSGNKSMFSELLLEKIQEKLDLKEQVILFYNRKGYATFVSCRMCGYALKCPRCDIALTYHHKNKEAKCSYCDYKLKVPKNCPECDSKYFKYFGAGTEKIEGLVAEHFPEAKIARLDSESTSRKGALEKIIEDVEEGHIDILLGTQMVTKGLDFKNVTLVGALSADINLNLPDYRAPEKTFQLLTQVAGRAGRGDKKGEVVIQTYTPDHYAISSAVTHDYHTFYEEEMMLREMFRYPPFFELASIMVIGENENSTIKSIHNLFRELERFLHKRLPAEKIELLGPNPAIFQKINNKYRWQIILKFDKIDMALVRNIIHYVCIKHRDRVVLSDVYINININPLSLL